MPVKIRRKKVLQCNSVQHVLQPNSRTCKYPDTQVLTVALKTINSYSHSYHERPRTRRACPVRETFFPSLRERIGAKPQRRQRPASRRGYDAIRRRVSHLLRLIPFITDETVLENIVLIAD
ncbi:unnamed protein product [Arctia plantaginis]|uniref:Uncharacterized protein n=1 Tax=Arctia plantaginis TaxID=874455 RepID=A0A8S1A5X7_ARCPL|nr:unnamed protein product [Arctia plantaginis]